MTGLSFFGAISIDAAAWPLAVVTAMGCLIVVRWLSDVASAWYPSTADEPNVTATGAQKATRLLTFPVAVLVIGWFMAIAWSGVVIQDRAQPVFSSESAASYYLVFSRIYRIFAGSSLTGLAVLAAWAVIALPRKGGFGAFPGPLADRVRSGRRTAWDNQIWPRSRIGTSLTRFSVVPIITLIVLAVAGPLGSAVEIGGREWGTGLLAMMAYFALTGAIIAILLPSCLRGSYALSLCFRMGLMSILPLTIIAGRQVGWLESIRLGVVTFQLAGLAGVIVGVAIGFFGRQVYRTMGRGGRPRRTVVAEVVGDLP